MGSLKKKEPGGKGHRSAGLREKDIKKRVVRRVVSDISPNQRAEAANKNSEALFRLLFENSADGILLTHPDGEIYSANPEACRMFGRTEEEIKKLGRAGIVDTRDPRLPAALEERRKTGKFQGELNLVKKEGGTFPGDISTKIFKDSSGNDRTVMIIRNLTERKRAEQALRISEERYRLLVENAAEAIFVAQDGMLKFVNHMASEMTGYSMQELLSSPFLEFIHPDDRDMVGERYLRRLRGDVFQTRYAFRLAARDGSIKWVEIDTVRVDWEGRPATLNFLSDITERKRAEEALLESEERFRAIVENAPFGYYRVGKDGLWQYVNPIWEQMHSLSLKEIIGKPFEITQPEGSVEQAGEYVKRALAGETIVGEFGRLTREGNVKYHSFNIQPVKHGKEIVAIEGFIMDITERRHAEEEIRNLAKFPSENPNPTLRIARDGTLLYTNQAGLSLLPEWNLQVGQAAPPMLREVVFQVMDSGSRQMLDLECRQRVYSFSFVPVVGAGYANLYGHDVTEIRQAEEALRKSESNLRALTVELSRVEESERQRLALFLHDEISQSLALLRMMFGSLAGASKLKSEKHNIQQIRNLLEKVIDQTHTLTFELSPPVLHQLGLEAAIEWAGEKISHDHEIEFTFSDDGMMKPIGADLKALLFRCARELMMNIVKHAKARRMSVSLTRMEERVFVVVEDDGVGFDKSLLERPQDLPGFGLFSVREHLTAMGGSFHLQSEPGRGTCVTLSVPLEEEKPSS